MHVPIFRKRVQLSLEAVEFFEKQIRENDDEGTELDNTEAKEVFDLAYKLFECSFPNVSKENI